MDIAPADQTAVEAMWASYVADSGYDGSLVTAFAFGDSAELADELGLLVLHGPKRATAELVQAFVAQDEPLPRVGDRCLVLGGDGRPLAIVRRRRGVHQWSLPPSNWLIAEIRRLLAGQGGGYSEPVPPWLLHRDK